MSDYQKCKNEVLASCEKVEEMVSALVEDAAKMGLPNPVMQKNKKGKEEVWPLLANIREKAQRVKDDRFSIMIAGEAKCGKSTFINAYLGAGILPMDDKQCTSALIRIRHGEDFFLRAVYADGQDEKITGKGAVSDFLKKNAAIDDAYRDIPVPTINNELLVIRGLEAKREGRAVEIPEGDIENLLNASEIQSANIHNLEKEEYERKIREYIGKKKDNWADIVTKIEISFPFDESLRGIEIIDSPGICARGGVADITMNYIENADAIIFLKPVIGQALVATQFYSFLENESVNRNKDVLFLVLTHITSKSTEALRNLESEAYKVFSRIDRRNILFVDSKAELYANKFSPMNEEEQSAELRKMNAEGKMEDFLKNAYITDPFNPGKKDFISELHERSRFEQVNRSLEAFGRKAHYLLLEELLDAICRLYGKFYSDLGVWMDFIRCGAEDPKELSNKIRRVQDELKEIENKIREGVGEVCGQFRGNRGMIRIAADRAVEEFREDVSRINDRAEDAYEKLEEAARKKFREMMELKKTMREKFVKECNEKLVALNDSEIPTAALEPDIEAILKEIRGKINRKKDEEKEITVDGWLCFKKKKKEPKYTRETLFREMRDDIWARLENIKEDAVRELGKFVDKLRSSYLEALQNNLTAKADELTAIEKQKATTEEKFRFVQELEQLQNQIKSARSEVTKLRGGIDKCIVR